MSEKTLHLSWKQIAGGWRVFVALCLLFGAAEGISRWILSSYGNQWEYWDVAAAKKFESFASALQKNKVPSVLIVGDSTAARDLDPDVVMDKIPGEVVYNLSWPSNFPGVFPCTTIPFLQQKTPRLLLVSFHPQSMVDHPSVRRLENNLLSSHYCYRILNGTSVSDYLALARLKSMYLLTRIKTPPPTPRGFMPLIPPKNNAAKAPDDAGAATPSDHALDPERLAIFSTLAGLCRPPSCELVVVIPPLRDERPGKTPSPLVARYRAALSAEAAKLRFTLLDFSDSGLPESAFHSYGHLWDFGAREYSAQVGAALAPILARVSR
jgi:hypothetical protein